MYAEVAQLPLGDFAFNRLSSHFTLLKNKGQEIVVLPKSTNPERINQNADVFDFEISNEDMSLLESFNENLITGWDPTNVL